MTESAPAGGGAYTDLPRLFGVFSYLYEDLGETRVWNPEWDGEDC